MQKGAELIVQQEQDDFLEGVKRLGYDPSGFVVGGGARTDVPLGNGQYAIRQVVNVQRRSPYAMREYEGGHGRAWAAAALADVEAGRFGPR